MAGVGARIHRTGRALKQRSALEGAALPSTGVGGRRGATTGKECTHSSCWLEVSLDHCDFSPHCKQPFGCKSLFCSGKEFHMLFHVVQILVKKNYRHHARSTVSTLNGLQTGEPAKKPSVGASSRSHVQAQAGSPQCWRSRPVSLAQTSCAPSVNPQQE